MNFIQIDKPKNTNNTTYSGVFSTSSSIGGGNNNIQLPYLELTETQKNIKSGVVKKSTIGGGVYGDVTGSTAVYLIDDGGWIFSSIDSTGQTKNISSLDSNGNLTIKGINLFDGNNSVKLKLDSNGNLIVNKTIISESDLIAFGADGSIGGSGGSGGLIQSVYGYNSLGSNYDNTNLTDTFNAYTINQINNRLVSVENGSATSINTTGTGNGVTSITKSGNVVTINKGLNFSLDSHNHSLNNLTEKSYNSLTDKPTSLSQFTNDLSISSSQVTTALGYTPSNSNHTHSQYLNLGGGTMSNTNKVINLNADLFDSIDSDKFIYGDNSIGVKFLERLDANTILKAGFYSLYQTTNVPFTGDGGLINIPAWKSNNVNEKYNFQIASNIGNNGTFYMRNTWSDGSGTWRELYHTGNFTPSDYLPVGGTALYSDVVAINNSITYGKSGLQMMQMYGNENNQNPTNEWYSHILLNHGNNAGYYQDIAVNFYSGDIYTRTLNNGTLNNWKKFVYDGSSINKLNVSGLTTDNLIDNSKIKRYSFSSGSAGWVRIGKLKSPLTGEAFGTISINNDYYHNAPAPVTFTFGTGYRGSNNFINQLGGFNYVFNKVRIVYPTTADTDYYLEIYCTATSPNNMYSISLSNSYNFELYNEFNGGSIPSNYSTYEINLLNGSNSNYLSGYTHSDFAKLASANTFVGKQTIDGNIEFGKGTGIYDANMYIRGIVNVSYGWNINNNSNGLKFKSDKSTNAYFNIDFDGNLGLGTTNTSTSKINITDNVNSTGEYNAIKITKGTSYGFSTISQYYNDIDDYGLKINDTQFVINKGGQNVGIGLIPDINYKLHVGGNTYFDGTTKIKDLYFNNSNISVIDSADNISFFGDSYIYFAQTQPTYFQNRVIFRGLISDDTNDYLSITGGISNQTFFENGYIGINALPSNTYRLNVNGNSLFQGNVTATGEITAYSTSDKRLKENIKSITDSLNIINKLNPVSYNWNYKAKELNPNKTDKTDDVGLIAQDVEKILPNLVHGIYNDEYKSIDYIKIIPYLIGSIQELTKEINELKNKSK